MSTTTQQIQQGDCIEVMQQMESESVDLVFADPPFNIGYEYDQYDDRRETDDYLQWSTSWMQQVHRILTTNGTFWLAIGDEFAAELKVAACRDVGFHARSWVVWYYTFGVNCKRAFSRSHTHLLHFVKNADDYAFHAEDPLVRVPSARALVYGDKRANPQGRLPDNTWILRPQDLSHGFQPMDDCWYFARVAGTFRERQGFHGCQMPEQLLGRIIRVSSAPGDCVFDPFVGSGTTLAVAKKLGRDGAGCELSSDYVEFATQRLAAIQEGDELDGPADPIASAPTTANGVRLDDHGNRIRPSLPAETDQQQLLPGMLPPLTSTEDSAHIEKLNLRELLRDGLIHAFRTANRGYSTDWLLADPELQDGFHESCRRLGLLGRPVDWNRELLALRKSGRLGSQGTSPQKPSDENVDEFTFAAEIAWRLASERSNGSSLDEIFCDPEKAHIFDSVAGRFAPDVDASRLRWAALRLRKSRKQIVAEVVLYHYVLGRRDFSRLQRWSSFRPDSLQRQAGVYLLRGQRKQPLYIGAAADLGSRLARHKAATGESRKIGQVAIIRQDELPSSEYLDLLRVDLVRRYRPTLNIDLFELPG